MQETASVKTQSHRGKDGEVDSVKQRVSPHHNATAPTHFLDASEHSSCGVSSPLFLPLLLKIFKHLLFVYWLQDVILHCIFSYAIFFFNTQSSLLNDMKGNSLINLSFLTL